jgi:uncharacterized protein (DUF305 family)
MVRSRLSIHLIAVAGLAAAQLLSACSPAVGQAPQKPVTPTNQYPGRYPFTRADIDFVTGMISHHAQAIDMSNLAPTRTTTRAMLVLTARVINAQTDEIVLMQQWLKDRNLPVPPAKAMPTKMMMGGTEHEMMMPGMLTDAQMKQLEQSRGVEFDRNFLTFMIQHHEGAITMVNDVLGAPASAQDEAIYKFASDIYADQTAEIDRMQQMLSALPPR